MPNFKFNSDFVPIPKDFIEHIMPSSNASYVMVYLYIMFLACNGYSAGTDEIAKKLGLIESDVINAIKYWNDKGIFSGTGDTIIVKKSVDEEISDDVSKKPVDEVTRIAEGDPKLADMFRLAQEVLGKTLSNKEIETLYWFYDQLGFSTDLVIMLLEYCVIRNKRNINYIEKVAITWHENNITTMAEAKAFTDKYNEESNYTSTLRKLFGIDDRNLSKTESLYIDTWRDELKMSVDMVGLAYDYCSIAIGKLSFPYINTILKRWAEQGITTVPEAEQDHEQHKQDTSSGDDEMTATENISEIEAQFMSAYDNNE